MERSELLNGEWILYYNNCLSGETEDFRNLPHISARVPGNVELDLKNAGYLPEDEFRGMATCRTAEYESYEWWYNRKFSTPEFRAGERVFLQCDGVDCIAEYFVNGEKIGESDNAFIRHEFDITNALNGGENELTIHICSALLNQLDMKYEQYEMLSYNFEGGIFLRKPAHCFGWDIFPRIVSAGIWKDIALTVKNQYDFEDIYYSVELDNELRPSLTFFFSVSAPKNNFFDGNLKVRINGSCGTDSSFFAECTLWHQKVGRILCDIKNPKLWWPYKYGEANVYDAVAELIYNDEIVAVKTINVGLRKIELRRTDSLNDENAEFRFVVNGEDIMCCGSNWVPLDAYHSRDKERYGRALKLVSDIGCNILRVWGGGVYEQEEFYNYCDRHGILIWQDFMMACHAYPMTEKMMSNMEHEFSSVIRELRHHPALALWAGDNEIDESLSWKGINPEFNDITRKLLPKLITRLDPDRPYLPSSPYICGKVFDSYRRGEDVLVERHLWGPRDYYKSDFYSKSKACFVSEMGYHGCPSAESVKKIVDEEYVWPIYNEQWILHSSDQHGNDGRVRLMDNQIRRLFGKSAESLEDFVSASQISQAEADKYFIERIRMGRPQKIGIIWWNLLDGWPQMSDAVVDYFFNKKLAYDYIKRSQASVALMIDEMKDGHYTLKAVNDTLQDIEGTYQVSDISTGEVFGEGHFGVKKNSVVQVKKISMMYSEQRMLLIEWTVNEKRSYNHYICGFPPFSLSQYNEWLNIFNHYVL